MGVLAKIKTPSPEQCLPLVEFDYFERTDGDVNVWPRQLGEPFKKAIMDYYDAVTALGRKLLQIFALSLKLDETYIDEYVTLPAVIARVLYYPPQTGEVDMKELGIGAHR